MTIIYEVTDEERAGYADFSSNLMKKLFVPPPPVLWHYTSASTFINMVDSKSVWSTQVSCLNDHSEFRYAVCLLREEFKTFLGDQDGDVRWLAKHVYDALATDGADT